MRMMKLEKIYDMTTEMASPNFLTRCDSLEEFPPLPAFYIQDHIQSASKCKCERRPKTLFWSLGLLNFRDKRGHQQDCPLYGTSEREVNVALQLAVPFIFAKSVQVVFKANWGAGGFAISPGVELKAIMVDRSQSPAFLCLDKLQKDYRRVWVEDPGRSERAALAYCQSVLLQLRTVLQKSPQSVREQDENGATILWEFVTGIGRECWWFPPQNVIFTPTVTEYVSRVIKMMVVDYGADPNTVIHCSSAPSAMSTFNGQTIMDIILMRCESRLSPLWFGTQPTSNIRSIESVLYEHGFTPLNSSLPNMEFDFRTNFESIMRLFNNPDLAEELGFPDQHLAIFRKSPSELLACIRRGVNLTQSHYGIPTPMVCALGWPQGLKFLLGLGLDATRTMVYARYHALFDAMKTFKEHCFPLFRFILFSSNRSDPLITPGDSPGVRNFLFGYASEIRNELAQIGIQFLPQEAWERQHLENLQRTGSLVDEYALDVWKALESSQLIPHSKLEYLWPGNRKSVYSYSVHGFNDVSEDHLQSLYDLGFHEVDIMEEDGSTPFLSACSSFNIGLTTWLISKGARMDPVGPWYAVRVFDGRHWFGRDHGQLSGRIWMTSLAPNVSCDTCLCFCSTSGCTPTAVLVRKGLMEYVVRRCFAKAFTQTFPSIARRASLREVCRLEIFERLDMTHTCCRPNISEDYKWMPLDEDEAAAIQEEETGLNATLDACMALFERLLVRFPGRLITFVRAWWAALDLFIPQIDYEDDFRSEKTLKSPWLDLEFFATFRITACRDENQGLLTSRFSSMSLVIKHFGDVIATFVRLANEQGPRIFADDHQISRFLGSLGVSSTALRWLQGSSHVYQLDHSCSPALSSYSEYLLILVGGVDTTEGVTATVVRQHFVEDHILPLLTASIIRDMDRGSWIPDMLRERLESDGVIVDGKLRPARWREDAEDIFERHLDILGSP
ncbi:hypothetical protein BKA81DRAFT_346525 [Phyllosticta paracitricarpa]